MKETKDIKQRIAEGEFSQSAEISASYLDEDILILDTIKMLANPDPVRTQMNMIASCQVGWLKANINGRNIEVSKNNIFVCPPNTTLDVLESSEDFACTAVCVTNRGIQNILHSHIGEWNRAMYVNKVSVIKMTPDDMLFYAKFTDLIRLCLSLPVKTETSSWSPFRREIVETLLKSGLLAVCNAFTANNPQQDKDNSSTTEIFDRFLDLLQRSEIKHQPVEYFARQLCITPKYLTIVCKKHTGRTAIEWITEYTLNDISYYLRSSSLSIKEIASRLGFTNTSFFGKYVREHFKVSPLKYRKNSLQSF